MSDDLSRVLREAQEAASGSADNILETLASRVGVRAGAHAAFGEPVDREGVTVIPVAKVRFGFGGGSGHGIEKGADLEIKDGRAEFKRTHDPVSAVPVILAAGFTAWLVLRALKRIVRG